MRFTQGYAACPVCSPTRARIITGKFPVRTGITAIRAHGGNQYFDRVPAAVHVGNAFGKLVGSTQVKELGELETPILLTCTLCVWKAADAMVEWMNGHMRTWTGRQNWDDWMMHGSMMGR